MPWRTESVMDQRVAFLRPDRAGIPLQRIGTPYEIWLALKFIVECDYFTGRVIEVDGGSPF